MGDDLAERLSHAVTHLTGTPTTVVIEGAASVGATRRTLFATLDDGVDRRPVVVQLAGLHLDGLSLATEAAVVRRADDAGVPVATPLVATDDADLVGSPFQIAPKVDGLSVPRHILRAVGDDPSLGTRLTADCATALARLHSIDPTTLPPSVPRLVDPTPAEAYVHHLRGLAANLAPSPVVQLGLRWLVLHLPDPPPRPAMVHSDLRNGNLIVSPGGARPGLAAVIDWELGHIGDPMEDLAWLCLRCWRFGHDDAVVGGFGHLDDLVSAYETSGGTFRPAAFGWWGVARTVWWCLILTLQASAFVHGLSDSLVLAASGRRVAEIEHDLLTLIDPARS